MATVIGTAVDSAAAVFTLPGQSESGDRSLVVSIPGGSLVAVVDGLGHGREAAIAAEAAMTSIRAHAVRELPDIAQSCSAALSGTRGAVMSLASFDTERSTMTWLGIGNVEGRLLLRASESAYEQQHLLLRPGVAGQKLPRMQASVSRVERGDMLIFATDGINPDFADHISIDAPIGKIADGIVSRSCKHTDDALALVVRYLG